MNPEFPKDEQAALEASLTALLLGELPHEEAAALHQKLAQDTELAKLYERLKQTANLVRETVARPALETATQPVPLKLAEERRQKLLQHFKTVTPKEFARPRRRPMPWLVPVGIAACLVGVLGSLFFPTLSRSKSSSPSLAFHTWSLQDQQGVALKRLEPPPGTRGPEDLNRNRRAQYFSAELKDFNAGTPIPPHPEGTLPAAESAAPLIVLPKPTESVEATTAPGRSEGALPGSVPAMVAFSSAGLSGGADGVGRASDLGSLGDVSQFQGTLRPKPMGGVGGYGGAGLGGVLGGGLGGGAASGAGQPAEVKQGNIALGDGSVQGWSRSRFQDALNNTGDTGRAPGTFLLERLPPVSLADSSSPGPAGQTAAGAPVLVPDGKPLSSPPQSQDFALRERYGGRPTTTEGTAVATTQAIFEDKVTASTHTHDGKVLFEMGKLNEAEAKLKQALKEDPHNEAALYYQNLVSEAKVHSSGKEHEVALRQDVRAVEQAWASPIEKPVQAADLELGRPPAGDPAAAVPPASVAPPVVTPPEPAPAHAAAVTQGIEAGQGLVQEKKPDQPPAPSEPAATPEPLVPLELKLPAPAFKGTPKDVPVLGDVPALGKAFDQRQIAKLQHNLQDAQQELLEHKAMLGDKAESSGRVTEPVAAGALRLNVEDKPRSVELARRDALGRKEGQSESVAVAPQGLGESLYSANVVGYVNPPMGVTNYAMLTPTEPNQRHQSSGVLPPAQQDTSLALNYSSRADQPSRQLADAKMELNKLQRFRQILDTKIASEKIDTDLPKTMTVEIVDKAVPQPAQIPTLGERIRSALGGKVERTARIKVEHDQSDISGFAERGSVPSYDPYFVQTEFEAIQSEAVLGKVIKDLNLNEAWGKKQAGKPLTTAETMALLKQQLDLRPERNTSIVDIGVKSEQPEEAAKIANAVAEAYRGYRLEQRKVASAAGIKGLEERFAEQQQKVREAQKKVDDLRAQLQISDATASGDGPVPLMTAETLRKLEGLRIEGKAEYARMATKVDRLKSLGKELGPEGLAQAMPSATADTLLNALLEQLTVAEQRLVTLERDYGPSNAEVIKCKALTDDLHSKIKSRVDGIMLGLETRVLSLSNSLDNLDKEAALATTNDVIRASQPRPYVEAKRNLEELQRTRKVTEKNAAAKASQTNQADAAPPKPVTPAPVPQPEVQTSDDAFSTFSLNVSDVSFKLAGASLEKGLMPEPATIRSEEFINAFDYRDPEPPPGVPVAFAWERAQYSFAQNRDLLRFSVKTAALGREPGRPLNLVLLLDNSGSMERADRVSIIHEALRVLAGQLQAQDKFSVVTFSRTARLWVDGAPGSDAGAVAMAASELTPQGGTNLEEAMNLGYQTALRHYLANGVNRVVLLTDGAANLGNVDPGALKQKVEANRKQGIALDCFGIGWEGYNDDLLEVLSRNGGGRYGFVNTPEEAATEFAGQLAGALHVAASDVKVQVEFNPARVTAYRQIGYAKHQLTKEQFRDNTVNAAQISAAESGNALYTVEVNPAGTGPLCTVRARFRIPGTADYREHAWDVPFTGNALPLEQSSPAMRLAATASAFAEWLVASPYAGEVTPDHLLGYLSGVPEVYGADARPKKLEWMIRQAKSIAGKRDRDVQHEPVLHHRD